ncbi:serine hydrolase [Dokdonella sp.]|uniref:serine hydrolase n=1 Tax=Dokdonella sp. TaxID=2291710 RepID=UPI0031BF7C6A|nr:serine hydrolase [Dokdonella sp.]
MKHACLMALVVGCSLIGAVRAESMTQSALDGVVEQRIAGDRTGACLAVAVVDKAAVTRSYRCAFDRDKGRIGPDSAFEIGSVSKTMTAALLTDLILKGKASLDDPLAAWLPAGTDVPTWHAQPILLRHVVTHTSGLPALPPGVALTNPADPYAALTAKALFAALGRVKLEAAPGDHFEYSNFAMMLLSWGIAHRTGQDLETLLQQRLFAPLGMKDAYIDARPKGVRVAAGHSQNATVVPAWHFPTDLAGVGGVHATLDDMVRYVQGNLGQIESSITPALAYTHKQLNEAPPIAMNWMLGKVGGRTVLVHEGGTGGFSSFVGIDPARQRGVVVLSDTALTALGGLGDLGLHLIDASMPLGKPLHAATPPAALLEALAGRYQLPSIAAMTLRVEDGVLHGQAAGQPEFELAYDDSGNFHPRNFDALLHPVKAADGSYTFTWSQGGAVLPATRVDERAQADRPKLSAEALAAYTGTYPLMPNFALDVWPRDGQLHARATGQGEFALDAIGKDRFAAAAYGIEIEFTRDADGKVAALDLHQAGHVLHGERTPLKTP